jgi:dolichol kinase
MRDEVARRLVHVCGVVIPLPYLLFPTVVTWRVVQAFLVVALAVALGLETVRLVVGLDWRIYERLTREYEQDNPAGYALYFVGMTVVALAFPPSATAGNVAVPAMLMLAVADPVSGLLSSGELRPVKQGWVLLATFGVATLLASPFVPSLAAVLGGVAATVADGVKPTIRGYVVDDNFSIPVAAAVTMYVVVEYLPRLSV